MAKYWTIFRQAFSEALVYRFNIILNILENLITPGFMLLALSRTTPTSHIQVPQLFSYYLLIILLNPLISSHVDGEMDNLADRGDVNNFLTKPLSFYKWLLVKEASTKIITLLIFSPLVVGLFFISSSSPLLISLSVIISFLLSFNLSYLVGLFCFWVDQFWAVHNVKHVITYLLGGIVLPYVFFPDSLAKVLYYTPFPYLANWNTRVISGDIQPVHFLTAISWILLFAILIKPLQYRAFKYYSHTAQ